MKRLCRSLYGVLGEALSEETDVNVSVNPIIAQCL